MKFFLLIFFVGYSVRCDDDSRYLIKQIPGEDVTRQIRKPLKVYWNVPTFQCRSKKIPFENLFGKFGILQNDNDDFWGDKIALLDGEESGLFPALLKNKTSGEFVFQNGGVPQEGNLVEHLYSFRNFLNQKIRDPNFSGVGIIDFESWKPAFRQNWGNLARFKNLSYERERERHSNWSESRIQAEAKERFEEAAHLFMENTLSLAKQMRPNAQWGYYGFPYCYNGLYNNMENCSEEVTAENDKISWMWSESTALYPSVYSSEELTSSQLELFLRGRVREAKRVSQNGAPILPYFSFSYREGTFLSEVDLQTALETFYKSGASGFIIWGASKEVNTDDKCIKLLNYIDKVMGPAIAKYTKNFSKADLLTTTESILSDDLKTSAYLDFTTIANYKTKIIKSANASAVVNENNEVATESIADQEVALVV